MDDKRVPYVSTVQEEWSPYADTVCGQIYFSQTTGQLSCSRYKDHTGRHSCQGISVTHRWILKCG